MAVPWIQVYTNLPQHPKTSKLAEALKLDIKNIEPESAAVGILISLWTWALQNQPDGDLANCSDRVIARACGWSGKPEVLVKALTESGFLDGIRTIHDWDEYAVLIMEANDSRKQKTRERVALYRERKRNADVTRDVTLCNADVTVTPPLQCNADVTPCNALRNADVTQLHNITKHNITEHSVIKEKEKKEKEKSPSADDGGETDPRYKVFRDDDEVLKRLKGEDAEFNAALARVAAMCKD